MVTGHYRNVLVDLEIPRASEQEAHTLQRLVAVKQRSRQRRRGQAVCSYVLRE